MSNNESLLDLFAQLYKWRKRIIAVTLTGAILTAAISLLLPNYFKATTVFYAASPDLAQPLPVGSDDQIREIYGQDTDLDRLFSIANSNEIIDGLIKKFDLYTHYDIDSSSNRGKHNIRKKFSKLYEAQKTKYDALSLSVEDKDPVMAANIANEARLKIDETGQLLIKTSQKNALESITKNIEAKESAFQVLTDSLFALRQKYKIFDVKSQGEAYGQYLVSSEGAYKNALSQYNFYSKNQGPTDSLQKYRVLSAALREQVTGLRNDVKLYNEGSPLILSLERERSDFNVQLSLDRQRKKQLEAAYNAPFNALHLVEHAEVPVYKSRPGRSIIVIGVALLIFLLMCLWVIVQDQLNKNNWREKLGNA